MPATTSRLLTLLSLLQTRRDWPGAILAERLDISHRTVRRDVERLREMGYSIHSSMGPDGGYRLDAGSELPPLLFDDDQAIALVIALGSVAASGADIGEAALRALTTVRQVMPSRLRHRLDAFAFTVMAPPTAMAGSGAPAVAPEVLLELSAAVRAREVLRFDYANAHSGAFAGAANASTGADRVHGIASAREPSADATPQPDAPPAPRRVQPHHLVTSSGRWYLVGWDLDRDDWRTFRADRISPRTPRGSRFVPREIPGGDVAEYVAARFKGSSEANRWPCMGTVILNLSAAEVAPFAADGVVEDLGPGRCSLELGSWSYRALAASLGRFDAAIEVLRPPELTEAFGELSRNYAQTAALS
ncbi:helix-turn-helix transcriptional regulator [Subtercola lobariae]|uniref:DeoR family transcriptional regulator n=1 Tax=Subtercola lobariae TaxID=1588641 RepID=A0A917BB67_9MICO|nr:WYL domain-containing protein [Subtercola lobariae]GGF34457.1 DeoR family transcriptional regulator [Subtercola lobariae]